MSGLFSTLNSSAGTLNAYEQALNVVQNNVSNASTPGFAAQRAILSPQLFEPIDGPPGGVQFTGAQSLRDEYSERFVQQQNSGLGTAQATVSSLSNLEGSFDITGASGLDAAMSAFFNDFSALSEDPNSVEARQQVLVGAQDVASAFQSVANATSNARGAADTQIDSTVTQINSLSSQIAQINQERFGGSENDPNLDATLHSDLEQLSNLANLTSYTAKDGTVAVLLDGQIPLVLGSNAYSIQAGLAATSTNAAQPTGTPQRIILDANGTDITAKVTGGQLSGLLDVRNTVLPGIVGDANQAGSLNQLAKAFADRVNGLLVGGQSASGPPAVAGVPLFQYQSNDDTGVARSLSVTSITPSGIATISLGPPYSANGIAHQIAGIANSTDPADQVNGQTVTDFYGQIAAAFGQQLATAKTNQDQMTQALVQAQSLRSQVSGVSLDQEAVNLTAFQRSYQAVSKLVTVVDQLTETTINLIP